MHTYIHTFLLYIVFRCVLVLAAGNVSTDLDKLVATFKKAQGNDIVESQILLNLATMLECVSMYLFIYTCIHVYREYTIATIKKLNSLGFNLLTERVCAI